MLAEQIRNNIYKFKQFGLAKYKLSTKCGLGRTNMQWPGILDLYGKSKVSLFNFLLDLNVQTTHCDIIYS